nr:biotin--[acetyl-CoA-carboxylase] ligase [Anaerocolumna cellulosilytica]
MEEVDSTNNVAKDYGKQKGNHGLLVIAEKQNAGKGRLGRSWNSPKGSGIWMSFVLKADIEPQNSPMLTLITALAVNGAIRKITGLETAIKWPNDVILNGKKTCGILTEMTAAADRQECIIIGIGINVSQEEFPEELKEKATSLWLEGKRPVSREELISEILNQFELYYKKFCLTESMEVLKEEYDAQLIHLRKQVRIVENNMEYEGIALGIDEGGALLVQVEQTNQGITTTFVKTVLSGEISVRGLKGYV